MSSGLGDLARMLVTDESLESALERILSVAQLITPADAGISVTMVDRNGRHPSTPSASSDLARAIDDVQYRLDEGPCLDALRTGEVSSITSLKDSARWPRFSAEAAALGAASSLAVPLMARSAIQGSLNLYARTPAAFTDEARERAAIVAAQAGVAVANVRNYSNCTEAVEQLTEALESRVVIEQAKGVLMEREHCDADRAFDLLRDASQRSNRKVQAIAQQVVVSAVQ